MYPVVILIHYAYKLVVGNAQEGYSAFFSSMVTWGWKLDVVLDDILDNVFDDVLDNVLDDIFYDVCDDVHDNLKLIQMLI